MKQSLKKPVIFGVALCAALSVSVSGQFNYASYTQTILEDIITEEQNHSYAPGEDEKGADCIQLECKVF